MGFQHVMPFINKLALKDIAFVRQYTATISSGSTNTTKTITASTKEKTFVIFSYKQAGIIDNTQTLQVTPKVVDDTSIKFQRKASGSQVDIIFWTIEFTASSLTKVEHISHARVADTDNVTINNVSVGNSFPLINWRSFNSGLANQRNMMAGEITASNNLQLRSKSGVGMDVEIQIIENLNWEVTKYIETMISTDTNEVTLVPSSPAQDQTWLITYFEPLGSGSFDGGQQLRARRNTSTNILTQRDFAGNFDISLIHHLIDGKGRFITDSDSDNINNTNTGGTGTINAVTVANSIIRMNHSINSWGCNSNGPSQNGERIAIALDFNSTTQYSLTRVGTTDNMNTNVEIVDFTNSLAP